jgi:cyclophilin family peptidyl-prolyl cis-trans isomerase
MNTTRLISSLILVILLASCNNSVNQDIYVSIKTTEGNIKVRLYNQTPLHRDNFIRLVKSHFYDSIPFHRVINGFMIQAGDESLKPGISNAMKDSLSALTVNAEFNPVLYHKKGALAAAREGNDVNPEMKSSATQFYIVQGKRLTAWQLDIAEQTINTKIREANFVRLLHEVSDSSKAGLNLSPAEIQERTTLRLYEFLDRSGPHKIPDDQRTVYMSQGGVPRLDGTYTVFGEVVEGLEVIDKIAAFRTDSTDKPLNTVTIIKMKIVRW